MYINNDNNKGNKNISGTFWRLGTESRLLISSSNIVWQLLISSQHFSLSLFVFNICGPETPVVEVSCFIFSSDGNASTSRVRRVERNLAAVVRIETLASVAEWLLLLQGCCYCYCWRRPSDVVVVEAIRVLVVVPQDVRVILATEVRLVLVVAVGIRRKIRVFHVAGHVDRNFRFDHQIQVWLQAELTGLDRWEPLKLKFLNLNKKNSSKCNDNFLILFLYNLNFKLKVWNW